MGTGYTRNDTLNNIADGNIINASDLDGEFDAVESAFNESTGHTHDGTAAEGAPITVLGPVQDFIASATEIKPKTTNTLDIGTVSLQFKDMYLDGTAYIDGLGEDILVATDKKVQFRDTALFINSSVDGQLDIDADVELELVAPTVDIDASTAVTIDTATLTITGSANVVGDLDVDNININGNTISSTDTNGNLTIDPNGTGDIVLDANVGIGTSSPQAGYKLHVNGAIQAENESFSAGREDASKPSFNFHDDTDTGIFNINPNILGFSTSGSERMRIDSSGNVGIGTGSPSRLLEVSGSAAFINIDSGANNNQRGIEFDYGGLQINGSLINFGGTGETALSSGESGSSGYFLTFKTDGSERMRIDSSGNLLVGASSALDGARITSVTTGSVSLGLNGSGGAAMIVRHPAANQIDFTTTATNSFFTFSSNTVERMRIDSSGNVGIGTTSPSELLQVNSTGASTAIEISAGLASTTTGEAKLVLRSLHSSSGTDYSRSEIASLGVAGGDSDLIFRTTSDASGPVEHMRIDSEGNVGIGTSSPGRQLHVKSSNATVMQVESTNASIAQMTFVSDGAASNPTIGAVDDTAFNIQTGNLERMRIDSSGKVGIGTTTNTTHSLFIHDSDYQQLGLSGTRPTIFLKETDGNADENYQIRVQNGNLQFETQNDAQTGSTERMRIDSSGNLLVGCTALPSGGAGGAGFESGQSSNRTILQLGTTTTATEAVARFYNPNGAVGNISMSGSSTAYNTSSDYRLKTAVNYDWDATTRLKQLRPARFEWIADGDDAVPVDGFLAHEVQSVVPEAITGTHNEVDDEGNPVYQGIDQSKLTPLLTKALIEAVEKIEQLEARIAALEAN